MLSLTQFTPTVVPVPILLRLKDGVMLFEYHTRYLFTSHAIIKMHAMILSDTSEIVEYLIVKNNVPKQLHTEASYFLCPMINFQL